MSLKIEADTKPPAASPDAGFKRVITASSALVLATVFGWLACVVRTENGDVEFHWRWRALIWIGIGIGITGYFWRQVWPAENGSRTLKREIKGWVVLAVPCVMWMAYPLRFISGQQLLNVCIGLTLAALVLAGGGCMVFKLIQGFTDEETPPSTPVSNNRHDPERGNAGQKPASPQTKTLGRDA